NINQGRGIQTTQEFKDSHVTLTPINPNGQQQSSSVSSQFVTSMLNLKPDAGIESIFETSSRMDVQIPTSVAPLPMSAPTITPSTIATITQQAPTPPTTALSTLLQDLPNFGPLYRFDYRLKTLEANFSEFMQTNQFVGAVSSIPKIAQAENDKFLKTIDENMQKIIKEQVKEQVKVQVSKILLKIEQTVNEQLEAKVLTRLSNLSKTSYVVAADLSKMELKKILIKKIEGNKNVAMMMPIKTKNPPLVQTEGLRDAEKERILSQQALQRRKLPGALASQLKGLNLDRQLVAGPTYELMKGSCKSLVELKFFLEEVYKATTDQLDWVNPEGALSRKYTTFVTKTKAADYSYQKKLNLTKPNTYHSDLKCKEDYSAYCNPRGFTYQNKDKKNRLKRIYELHKFNDGTVTDVCAALDDRLKGIQIKYLPKSISRKSDKDRAAAMIQAIDKMLNTRRIMRSLERFIGGRLYEEDFKMLQRTI
nr:hypothetical protein [Tanacetum cinerariifolium]